MYRDAERTLAKLLDEMRRGRLPAQLLPLVNDFHTAVSADSSRSCHLLALSHDGLGLIFDGLADPLQPVVAVAFSSTCLGLRTPLQAALEVLKERHARAVALCRKVGSSCAKLCGARELDFEGKVLTADDMATIGMLLAKWLPRLRELRFFRNGFGDAGVFALCEALDLGAAPMLWLLDLGNNQLGPAGAKAVAAAFRRGALPKLEDLSLNGNIIGNQGVAALAVPLRTRPALKLMYLVGCGIGDEGLTFLVANLYKVLQQLWLADNYITDAGMATLAAAIHGMRFPSINEVHLEDNLASDAAYKAVDHAIAKALHKQRLIRIKIVYFSDGSELYLVIKANSMLQKLMTFYCKEKRLAIDSVRFLFKGNQISKTQTPDGLGMADGDVQNEIIFEELHGSAQNQEAVRARLRQIDPAQVKRMLLSHVRACQNKQCQTCHKLRERIKSRAASSQQAQPGQPGRLPGMGNWRDVHR